MGNLLRYLTGRNALLAAASATLIGGFQLLIAGIVKTLDLDSILQQLMTTAPPFFSAMIGEQFAELSVAGVLAFGWNHPVVHVAGAAVAIILGSRAVAGEIDQGAAELVMTQPLSRGRYFAAHVVFGFLVLALLAAAGVGGTLLGAEVYGVDRFPVRDLALAGLNFWLLQIAWFAIAIAVSAVGREGGRVATIVFFVALISYLIAAVGSVWDPAARFLPLSLHYYYAPQEILVQKTLRPVAVVVLTGVTVVFIALGARAFSRRDIP